MQINYKLNSKPLRPIRQYEKRREISIQAMGLHDIHKLNHQLTLLLLSIRIRTAHGLFTTDNIVWLPSQQKEQSISELQESRSFKSFLTSFWLAFWVPTLMPWSRLFSQLFLGCTSHKYHANQNYTLEFTLGL